MNLLKGINIAYRDGKENSSSSSDPTQQNKIGWKYFVREILSKEPQHRCTGSSWTKIIIQFMLETHVSECKYRCNLHFQAKKSHHNN